MVFYFNSIILPSFSKDKFVKINLFLSFLGNILIWTWLGLQAGDFSDLASLHYNIYFGIDLIGPWYQIFFLPSLGLGILVANFLIGSLVFNAEKLLSYFLVGASSLTQFLLLLASVFIVTINF